MRAPLFCHKMTASIISNWNLFCAHINVCRYVVSMNLNVRNEPEANVCTSSWMAFGSRCEPQHRSYAFTLAWMYVLVYTYIHITTRPSPRPTLQAKLGLVHPIQVILYFCVATFNASWIVGVVKLPTGHKMSALWQQINKQTHTHTCTHIKFSE